MDDVGGRYLRINSRAPQVALDDISKAFVDIVGATSSPDPAMRNHGSDSVSCIVEQVKWAPGFLRLPLHIPVAGCRLLKPQSVDAENESGLQTCKGTQTRKVVYPPLLYGIDVASGAAVMALDPHPGMSVLDLCCAPGTCGS